MSAEDPRIQLAQALYDVGAFLDRTTIRPNNPDGAGFRLKLHETQPNAPYSPYFLNLRTPDNPKPGPLTPAIVESSAKIMYGQACQHQLKYHKLSPVPNAGDPFADAFSIAPASGQPIPVLRLGKKETPGGRKVTGIVSGVHSPGDVILIIDDLITGADSKLEAVGVLQEAGLRVNDVLVLVDRQQGGGKQLKERGIILHAVFTITKLLDIYVATGRMSPALYAEIKDYMVANG